MRDPERIDRICKLLEEKWRILPEMTLGEFLLSYVFRPNQHHTDHFLNTEDEVAMGKLIVSPFMNIQSDEEAFKNMDRIQKICSLIREGWQNVFDWRLGQLLINIVYEQNPPYDILIFGQEDDETEELLKNFNKSNRTIPLNFDN